MLISSDKNMVAQILKNRNNQSEDQLRENLIWLSKYLTKKRKEKNITQKELAKLIGTHQSAISRFEMGKHNPTICFLRKIGYALGLEIKIYWKKRVSES